MLPESKAIYEISYPLGVSTGKDTLKPSASTASSIVSNSVNGLGSWNVEPVFVCSGSLFIIILLFHVCTQSESPKSIANISAGTYVVSPINSGAAPMAVGADIPIAVELAV